VSVSALSKTRFQVRERAKLIEIALNSYEDKQIQKATLI
jgi:hypothetical protein